MINSTYIIYLLAAIMSLGVIIYTVHFFVRNYQKILSIVLLGGLIVSVFGNAYQYFSGVSKYERQIDSLQTACIEYNKQVATLEYTFLQQDNALTAAQLAVQQLISKADSLNVAMAKKVIVNKPTYTKIIKEYPEPEKMLDTTKWEDEPTEPKFATDPVTKELSKTAFLVKGIINKLLQ